MLPEKVHLDNEANQVGTLLPEAHPPSKIWVSGPRLQSLLYWKEMGTHVTTNNGELLRECDVIILGVKPAMLEEAIHGCISQNIPSSKHILFVSMLTGVNLSTLKKVRSYF